MSAVRKAAPAGVDREPANEPAFQPRQAGTFLDADDLAELTGIRGGNKGHTRAQRQIAALVAMKVPHYINAAGLPVVARAVVEGGRAPASTSASAWQPTLGR